jgi:uncharacterized membrane protein
MQISRLATGVAVDFARAIDRLYPAELGRELALAAPPAPRIPPDAFRIVADGSGYVQRLDADTLLHLAASSDVVLWVIARPGDFVVEGTLIAAAHPRPPEERAFAERLNAAYVLGEDRTAEQDAGFAVRQLVEVALRALSPGVNEPFTAITCIDRLGEGLARLAQRRIPASTRADDRGRLRLITQPTTFDELLTAAFEPVRRFAGRNPDVSLRLLRVIEQLEQVARRDEDRAALRREATAVRASAARELQDDAAREQIEQRFAHLEALFVSGHADPAERGSRTSATT